ncbi:MAG: hypothetical protein ACOVQX_01350 [Legionella sp.]
MTLDELYIKFQQSIEKNTLTVYAPVKRPQQTPHREKELRHRFYPIKQLEALIDVLSKMDDDEDDDYKFSIRYLVTEDKQLLLAREGKEGKYIPAHKTIRNRCLAAGNLYFSRDFKKIIKINHQSGDFQPSIESLLWPLAILYFMQAPLEKNLIIELNKKSINHTIMSTELIVSDIVLKKLLPHELATTVIEANQATAIEENNYNPQKNRLTNSLMKRTLLFFEDISHVQTEGSSFITGSYANLSNSIDKLDNINMPT